ncbi:MAG: serine--tRNA ligase [Fastidiosipilaceae bacterium]|jgi:seryl-tRNA synthetase
MLDIQLIRKDPEFVQTGLAKRGFEVDFADFLALDKERRALIAETEGLKAERNKVSAQIPKIKKEGGDVTAILAQMKELATEIKGNDERLARMDEGQRSFLDGLPNLPDPEVVAGGKEQNEVWKIYGEKPSFEFEPRHHVDIAERLGLIDYTRGAKLSGSGFWVYRGDGARLEWALLNYFIETHLNDGYEMMLVPHLLNYQCGYTAGQFPKFEEDVYWLDVDTEADHRSGQFLLPTAETALVNIHKDEILNAEDLPKKYFAYSPCYRKEAGSYRAEERGMIRGHQFNKVEMFQYTLPEQSDQAFTELVEKAAKLMEGLGLHHRISKLAAGDCSASMAKTYDVEVWIPSMEDFKEVSSASSAGDYQARRGAIRFRRDGARQTEFVHTLNASGLATSRVLPAIFEQFQRADGSVMIPEVLRKWMNGQQILRPAR